MLILSGIIKINIRLLYGRKRPVGQLRPEIWEILGNKMNPMKSEEIKQKYKKVIFKAGIISAIAIVLALPKVILSFTGYDNILGIDKPYWRLSFYLGFFIYISFLLFKWKCPSCGKYPGGWFRKKCRSCGCRLF